MTQMDEMDKIIGPLRSWHGMQGKCGPSRLSGTT